MEWSGFLDTAGYLIDKPTRGENTLDIVLTNAARNDVIEVSSSRTCMSDHNLIGVKLGYNTLENNVNPSKSSPEKYTFHSLDIRSGDIPAMQPQLADIDWLDLYSLCPDDEGYSFTELIRLTVLQTDPHFIAKGGILKLDYNA